MHFYLDLMDFTVHVDYAHPNITKLSRGDAIAQLCSLIFGKWLKVRDQFE